MQTAGSSNKPNPKVDFYFAEAEKWQAEITKLRTIILGCGLTEELKWGCPCYTVERRNIVLIHVFKEYCAILFFKGALLSDPKHILITQTENVQSARQLRFTNAQHIDEIEAIVKDYIYEAVEVEQAGLKVELKTSAEFAVPEEFQTRLDENPALKTAFYALTPGRQRGYLLHFAAPKQARTRQARVDKYTQHILDGKGLND